MKILIEKNLAGKVEFTAQGKEWEIVKALLQALEELSEGKFDKMEEVTREYVRLRREQAEREKAGLVKKIPHEK